MTTSSALLLIFSLAIVYLADAQTPGCSLPTVTGLPCTVGTTAQCGTGLTCTADATDPTGQLSMSCCAVTTTTLTTRTTTGASNCVDLTNAYGVSDCPARAYLCTNPTYQSLMRQQCPATCGVCGTAVTFNFNVPCFDMQQLGRPSDCPRRASYCFKNPWVALMRVQCPATCGYCTTTTSS